jgi:Domain of unknown function (DUF1707)/Domain of unknown function (DUF4190)
LALDPRDSALPIGHEQMRASNADRERAIDVLKAGFAEGRLTKEEFDQRAGQVYSSRTYAELADVTADLPAEPLSALSQQQTYPMVAGPRRVNRMAIASLVCALFPGMPGPFTVIIGILARRQIRERGDRGVGLANAAIVIGSFFTLVFALWALGRF